LRGASSGRPPAYATITAADLVALLDAAAIRRALVLSVAYMYDSPARNSTKDEYARVRAENDWTSAQTAQYPDQRRAFGSFNPLKDYALDEITRCAKESHLCHGIKLHFGNSDVQLDNAAHLESLRRVFQAANENGMAIVVHLRASISRNCPYGKAQARVFLDELLSLVPDVPVQVAHLAGSGRGYDDPAAHSVMAVLAEAVADLNISPPDAARMAQRIRQVGVERVLYGEDATVGNNLRPREGWAAFRRLPLTEDEFGRIANNVAPYFP
jgi:predicted TIM-barrel fold metal-dependent hydrolase